MPTVQARRIFHAAILLARRERLHVSFARVLHQGIEGVAVFLGPPALGEQRPSGSTSGHVTFEAPRAALPDTAAASRPQSAAQADAALPDMEPRRHRRRHHRSRGRR